MRSSFDFVRTDSNGIWIRDLDGKVSVTNDAEAVVRRLNATFPGKRIFYRDTMGNWDELRHDYGIFTGFAPVRELAEREGMK